jgi:hypothetical protein
MEDKHDPQKHQNYSPNDTAKGVTFVREGMEGKCPSLFFSTQEYFYFW